MWCAQMQCHGASTDGAFTDLLLTNDRNCLPLPTGLSLEVGTLLALYALHRVPGPHAPGAIRGPKLRLIQGTPWEARTAGVLARDTVPNG